MCPLLVCGLPSLTEPADPGLLLSTFWQIEDSVTVPPRYRPRNSLNFAIWFSSLYSPEHKKVSASGRPEATGHWEGKKVNSMTANTYYTEAQRTRCWKCDTQKMFLRKIPADGRYYNVRKLGTNCWSPFRDWKARTWIWFIETQKSVFFKETKSWRWIS